MRAYLAAIATDSIYVLRRLVRRPLYATSAVAVLALAMGASMAVFGLVDTLFLRPLDTPRPEELATLQRSFVSEGVAQRRTTLSWSQVSRVRSITALRGMAVTTTADDTLSKHVVATVGDRLDDVAARFVTWNYLHVLGIRPLFGRDLDERDDRLGAAPVAVLTHAYWQSHFGASKAVLGQVVHVNGVATTVVGVLGPTFVGTELGVPMPALFLPLHSAPAIGRDSLAAGDAPLRLPTADGAVEALPVRPAATFAVIARLPGDRSRAQAEVVSVLRSDQWAVVPLTDTMLPFGSASDLSRFVRVLGLAVALTLALGCVNIGILFFGEVEDRRRELTLRLALGARVSKVMQLLAIELLALSFVAAALAAGVFAAITSVTSQLGLPGAVAIGSLRGDTLRVGLFGLLLSLGVAVVIGAIPMWRSVANTVRAGDGMVGAAVRRRSLRALAVFQIAGCVAMTVSAVLFVRVVAHGMQSDLGFNPSGLISAVLGIPADRRNEQVLTYAEAFLSDVRDLPGVRSATIGPVPLVTGSDWRTADFHVDGQPISLSEPLDLVYASDDYFTTLEQQGLRGRDFGSQDTPVTPFVAVVNEAAARLFWHSVDPLSHRIALDMFKAPRAHRIGTPDGLFDTGGPLRGDVTVVGVVRNSVLRHLGETDRPIVYLSRSQFHDYLAGFTTAAGTVSLIVRSAQPVAIMSGRIADAARSRGLRIESIGSVVAAREAMLGPQRLARAMLLFLSGIAVVVTLAGTYAMAHMAVLREQKPNAVRMAMGATPGRIIRSGVIQAVGVLAVGALTGAASLWWGSPLLERFGLGLSTFEPVTIALTSVAIITAGTIAAYLPSRRITRIDPAHLLRD